MARNERRIDWSYFLDARNFVKGNKDAQRSLSTTEKAMGTLKKAFGAVAVAFGAREVVQWAGDAVQLAAAAEEVDSKFQAVFGSADELTDQLREWGDVAGVTETKGKDLAATFGNLAQAQGISLDKTKDLTVDVATLAGDLASFNDADPSEVFFNLNKALLTTEREGLKQYGIAISEAEVKQRALEIATNDGRTSATKADRAMASYAIAVEQAGQANGDLERTADSTANKQRQLKASMTELQEEVGQELLPAFHDLLQIASDLTPAFRFAAKAAAAAVGPFGDLAGAAADLTDNDAGLPGLLGAIVNIAEEAGSLVSSSNIVADGLRNVGDGAEEATEAIEQDLSGAYRKAYDGALSVSGAVSGLSVGLGTKLPEYARQGAAGVNELNGALAANIDLLGALDSALSGDLFRRYKQFAETGRFNDRAALEALGAGGRGNADYDRGEDYTNAQTVYNSANGIS